MIAHGPMAWVLWLLGYPDQALTRSHAMLTYAQELQHAFSLARALHDVMTLHKLRGEANAAQEWAEAALAIMTEQGFGHELRDDNVHAGLGAGGARAARGGDGSDAPGPGRAAGRRGRGNSGGVSHPVGRSVWADRPG